MEINSLKDNHIQLASPNTISSERKRKRSQSSDSTHDTEYEDYNKKPKTSYQTPETIIELDTRHPVAYWASTQTWPPNFSEQNGNIMSVSSNKRKSESTHSHRSDRLTLMEEYHIYMQSSQLMADPSKKLCSELLQGDLEPITFPGYPAERVLDVLARVESANKERIQRDVMPIVVPPAETLYFCGVPGLESIVEELSAPWIRCASMGSTNPKPDYVAGLSQKAFSSDELARLRNYATLTTPFLFTPNLCFPFVICEAKDGDEGMNKAHRQNLHSAAIAVRAIHELCWAAYGKSDHRVKELNGKVLVFTIAHNHDTVHIYGHFALSANALDLGFYRVLIAVFHLTTFDGRDLNKSQNFVRNVYDKFAPQHLNRIKEAAKKLPPPDPLVDPALLAYGPSAETESSRQSDSRFKIPGEPASAIRHRELMQQLEKDMEQQRKEMEQQRKEMEQRMEHQMEQRLRKEVMEQMEALKASLKK
ncbi:MAG: hypothetical protein Q9163_005154 [Psora crenata]